MDKLNQLSLGEKLIVGAGVLLLIASFLPWYKVSYDLGELGGLAGLGSSLSYSASGWQNPGSLWSILAVLIGLAMAGSIIAAKFGNMALPDLGSITWGQAYLGGGGAAVLLIVIKFIVESSYLSYGFYLGFLCVLALAAGGYLLYTEEKTGVVRR